MYKFTIQGTVQGVGFRPYIYNACVKAGLVGYVQNIGTGVVVEVNDKEAFLEILKNVPPLARIDSVKTEESSGAYADFTIKESCGAGFAEIPSDLYLCEDCQRDLNNPGDRRFKYFFITCTNCGPRFTIAKRSPYDRRTTTMSDFALCKKCAEEYADPENRRYHAQTIACHDCGPKLSLRARGKTLDLRDDASLVKAAAELLKNNELVAIKGIGGFHIACSTKPQTVARLRRITKRDHKPYAIMCRDLSMARRIAHISEKEKEELVSPQRPIVVLKKKMSLKEVSELDTVGVMLPYTALHYLLFDYYHEPLVMTSSNISDEPISTHGKEQFVENILDHSRTIENPADDSVVKVIQKSALYLRRSRGRAPQSLDIQGKSKEQILAMGAELNNAFCIYKEGKAIPSQYMGNTAELLAFENYKRAINKFLHFTRTQPSVILHDLHPQYNTSLYAAELSKKWGTPLAPIQHHKAHAYSVAREHGLYDFAAIVCDGLGYGEDGSIWGGEVFDGKERIGHLEAHLQLGGDSATVYPAKMLYSILRKFLGPKEIAPFLRGKFSESELSLLERQREEKFNSPITTSCGRVLDAVSFLLGFCDMRTYDGRPAMLLEAFSSKPYDLPPVIEKNVLLTTPLFEYLIRNLAKDKQRLAATVQLYIVEGLYEIASRLKKPIVFSGGCAYNRIMTSFLVERGVLINKNVPPGDGGISFGQIAYYLADSGDKRS